jgi:hypothetical protein
MPDQEHGHNVSNFTWSQGRTARSVQSTPHGIRQPGRAHNLIECLKELKLRVFFWQKINQGTDGLFDKARLLLDFFPLHCQIQKLMQVIPNLFFLWSSHGKLIPCT